MLTQVEIEKIARMENGYFEKMNQLSSADFHSVRQKERELYTFEQRMVKEGRRQRLSGIKKYSV